MEFPYKAEYAKSGRASCRACKAPIGAGSLRIAVMVQSPKFDGKYPLWFHHMCFFNKQRPKSEDDIEHFENLRWEDQEKIREKIGSGQTVVVPEAKKGKKRAAAKAAAPAASGNLKDFDIEYAKSSRALCRGCEIKIMKSEIRISKKDYETEVGKKFGGQSMWHHLTCFAKMRSELGYYAGGDCLPGFQTLNKTDQKEVNVHLPPIKQEDIPEPKKPKVEEEVDNHIEDEIKKQNKIIFKNRDNLKRLGKNQLQLLLEKNDQHIPVGVDRILDLLADNMTFGKLLPCKECPHGQLIFNKIGYVCQGDLTEWTKCSAVVKKPERAPFKIPKDLAEEYTFLGKYKYKPRVRAFKDVILPISIKKEDEVDGKPKVERERPPLYNMEFVLLGKLEKDKDNIKKIITSLGGKVVTKISNNVMAVISNKNEVEKLNSRMLEVRDLDIQVVSEEFLDEAKEYSKRIPELVIKKCICDWGGDPSKRLPAEPSISLKSKSKSIYTSKMPSKVTLKLKGGNAVDPESGLENKAHVYQNGSDKYTAVLSKTDLQRQKNSFYKLQLLQSDKGQRFWVFRAWGRIGTTIGGTKLEDCSTLQDAKKKFEDLYEEKSGNCWENRHNFMKVPGLMYPIDIDYGEDEAKLEIKTDVPSNLPKPVQELMHLIFDINNMKKVMLEFELDTEKMPLGKLSRAQMLKAYTVLNELQGHIEKKAAPSRFIDGSNRFYTYIPHSCGVDELPILDNLEIIKQKIEMIDNLMEMEIAYSLMKESSTSEGVDGHYEKLNTEVGILEPGTEEFKILEEYVRNTHAATHDNYELEIQHAFTIKRQGEEKRFKPFKKLHNRKLLWHGSRVTNFAGILSQGLRIAPPEAPVTGYMFGKGIYFADMVSKSANYCCTNKERPTGLLLLCDVALGDMYERTKAEYVEKLPKGKHSCKGIGRTQPDPKHQKKLEGKIEVPLGKGVDFPNLKSHLLYNEYIVYDVAQVNVKYMLQLNFKYKY